MIDFYAVLKDIASALKKAGKIELYNQVLALQGQALEMLNENVALRQKNAELEEQLRIKDDIERHDCLIVTLKNDPQKIPYCSICWDNNKKLIQVQTHHSGTLRFSCSICGTKQEDANKIKKALYGTANNLFTK